MPIVDIQIIGSVEDQNGSLASKLAAAMGDLLGIPKGSLWVRLSYLSTACYAENGINALDTPKPVFVTVLHADIPEGEALAREARAISSTIGQVLVIVPTLVHIEYAPPGRGRMAFGGNPLS